MDCLHQLFYSELNRLFDKYKHLHMEGYEKLDLRIQPPVSTITREEFVEHWKRMKAEQPDPDVVKRETIAEDLNRIELAWKEYFVTALFGLSCSLLPYMLIGQD